MTLSATRVLVMCFRVVFFTFSRSLHRYTVAVLRLSPWSLGWPARRPRKFTVMLLRSSFEWLGCQAEFDELYSRQVMLKGDVFFCAPQEDLDKEWMAAASAANKIPSEGHVCDPLRLLTPAQRRRCQEHADVGAQKYGDDLLADVMQETTWSSAGPFAPPLLQNSILFSKKQGRTAIPREHLVMQGIPAFDFLCEDGDSLWPSLTERRADFGPFSEALLSASEVKSLAGNAMHAACVAAVSCYAVSRAASRPLLRFRRLASVFEESDSGDDTYDEQCEQPPKKITSPSSPSTDGPVVKRRSDSTARD